ncbi:UNKNOWN [Stylonychia lemnae]|uniref:Uncharacterized protein n=1 Tax=Stylonychia lemnae TaxID=5949 RepID=A0A078AKS1_STYLE|nr:UNKNOWN [Stylonychia lemnae]|eukprot:CDW81388.1 UNKNOWN [Stylonychia lemnae]
MLDALDTDFLSNVLVFKIKEAVAQVLYEHRSASIEVLNDLKESAEGKVQQINQMKKNFVELINQKSTTSYQKETQALIQNLENDIRKENIEEIEKKIRSVKKNFKKVDYMLFKRQKK